MRRIKSSSEVRPFITVDQLCGTSEQSKTTYMSQSAPKPLNLHVPMRYIIFVLLTLTLNFNISMKFSSYLICGWLIASSGASPISSIESRATTWCGSFGSQQAGPYTIYHNNWGAATATSGQQCTTFNSFQGNSVSWSTSWTWAGGSSNVKSYSNVALEKVNKALSGIKSIPSAWSWQ